MSGDLDREYAIWVTREELGRKKEIHLEGSVVTFMVPPHIDGHVVLRLKGLGHRRGSQKGNLLVRISLLEESRSTEWSPFRRDRQQTAGGGSGPFSRMQRTQEYRGETTGPAGSFAQRKAVDDPMQMRRAGYLITGAGLVLVFGVYMGVLPVSAWAGTIIIVAGMIVAFFA